MVRDRMVRDRGRRPPTRVASMASPVRRFAFQISDCPAFARGFLLPTATFTQIAMPRCAAICKAERRSRPEGVQPTKVPMVAARRFNRSKNETITTTSRKHLSWPDGTNAALITEFGPAPPLSEAGTISFGRHWRFAIQPPQISANHGRWMRSKTRGQSHYSARIASGLERRLFTTARDFESRC
jgi:hypothetical protein